MNQPEQVSGIKTQLKAQQTEISQNDYNFLGETKMMEKLFKKTQMKHINTCTNKHFLELKQAIISLCNNWTHEEENDHYHGQKEWSRRS